MIRTPRDSFSRPANATAYTANDLVANSVTAGSVEAMKFSTQGTGAGGRGQGKIRRVRLFKDDVTVTNASFTLHLFTQDPAGAAGDNAAFAVTTSEFHLGSIAIDMSSGALPGTADLMEAVAVSPEINFFMEQGDIIYGLLEAEAGYVPASGETFTVTLEIEHD